MQFLIVSLVAKQKVYYTTYACISTPDGSKNPENRIRLQR